jgi:prolyl-tRNA synthetase
MPALKREKWSKQFGEWFREDLINAEIMDYRYPIKGCGVWMPYGFKIRKSVLQVLRNLLDSTEHQEALFPLLIPETSLNKEAAHVRSFEDECFWVTHGGLTPLETKYALRPTSETVIGPMLKLWVRSHIDLPLKLYQVVNIFRYETEATRPILRMREVATFKEAHTSHATSEDAEAQVNEALGIYKSFFDVMGVPYCVSRRPDWDRFAGALYSIAFDMICPDGRSLQIGTVHNLGQNFSRAFDITYETKEGTQEHIWQTCYGISGRAIAAMLIAHGDDHGVVLPPKIAPIEVVIVPIPYEEKGEQIEKACEEIAAELKAVGIQVKVDLRDDLTPGAKYYYWELRGIPIRLEIGPKEVENKEITVVRRDTLKREKCKLNRLVETIQSIIESMGEDLRDKAWQWMKNHIFQVNNLERAKELLDHKAGIVEVPWCGKSECGHKLQEKVGGRLLGIPEDIAGEAQGTCLICGLKAENIVRIAFAY